LVSASRDGLVKAWDVRAITADRWSISSRKIIGVRYSRDGLVKVWDVRVMNNGGPVVNFQPQNNICSQNCSAACLGNPFSANDRSIAASFDITLT
jgi:WD40 repeat protein